jgi:hypothetical protein
MPWLNLTRNKKTQIPTEIQEIQCKPKKIKIRKHNPKK